MQNMQNKNAKKDTQQNSTADQKNVKKDQRKGRDDDSQFSRGNAREESDRPASR